MSARSIPKAFFWRRLHSLMGLWLVLFLIEHLLTNSQAALWLGEDGTGFIYAVNAIYHLPYLQVIEVVLLGVPIAIHLLWGIKYLRTGELNSFPSDGTTPSLTKYSRNQAYSWQRITSWILLFALVGHIVHMRFMEYPYSAKVEAQDYYMVRVRLDDGLYTLAERLNVRLYDKELIELQRQKTGESKGSLLGAFWNLKGATSTERLQEQERLQQQEFTEVLEKRPLQTGQVIAVAKDFGTAELLMVRETFKYPLMLVLYTILVLSACFHGFNGLWTFLITWGFTLTARSQRIMRTLSTFLMVLTSLLGLAAIWGTYWVNLRV